METKEDNTVKKVLLSAKDQAVPKVKANAQITLTVSSGKSQVKITDVSNMTEETAKVRWNV